MDPVVFRGKRIFITGGTGYLGSLLLRRLKGHADVTVLTRDPEKFSRRRPELIWPGLRFLKGEIESFRFPDRAGYDFVVHGGNPADLPKDPEGQAAFRRTALDGTIRLLSELEGLEKLPGRILLLSSGAVYGPQPSETDRLSENREPAPGDAYGEAKLATERAVAKFAGDRGIGAGIARIFACAGAYLPLEGRFALGQFIRSARDRGEIRILSDGTPKRTYLDGDELADWLLTLLAGAPDAPKAIDAVNIGSNDIVSIREVAEIVREVFEAHGKAVAVSVADPDPRRPASPDYVPDIRKIAEKYGLKPKKSSGEAIRDATEWALNET